jgi:hypothetical protein
MSGHVMTLVSETLAALQFAVEAQPPRPPAPRREGADGYVLQPDSPTALTIKHTVKRLAYMMHAFSLDYKFSWDPVAAAVVMSRKNAPDPKNKEAYTEEVAASEMTWSWNSAKAVFTESIANRVSVKTQHRALVMLGQSLRITYAKMVKHMKAIKDAADNGSGGDGGGNHGGYSTVSSYILMRQLQEVASRLLVEEMLWWMSRNSVLYTMAGMLPGLPGNENYAKVIPRHYRDVFRFEMRSAGFRVFVPLAHEQMREFGMMRIGRAAAMDTRALLRKSFEDARSAAMDAEDGPDDGAGSSAPSELPSVNRMMAALLSVTYIPGNQFFVVPEAENDNGQDGESSFFTQRASLLLNKKINVSIDDTQIADALSNPGAPEADPALIDCEFAARLVAHNSVFRVAYDLRLEEYTLGPRTVVSAIVKKLLGPRPRS